MATTYPDIKRLVVKIGTSLLSNQHGFEGLVLEEVVKDLAALKNERDLDLIIVSSGAMGCGMEQLRLSERPTLLPLKQATAAVGQARLMHYYEALFQTYGDGLQTAQVLLSANDLDDRRSYLNLRNTLNAIFGFNNVIPIINENDSTAPEELRFGDNDTLAARVASKIDAELLIILSNVDGLYDADPGIHPDASLIEHVDSVTPEIEALAHDTKSQTSIGGMSTKLNAAKIACATGVPMVIANGHRPKMVTNILEGRGPMTHFGASDNSLSHRKRWIAFGRSPKGTVHIDKGASDALRRGGKSLLATGILSVDGDFEIGEAVFVKDSEGNELARGIVNYSCREVDSIKGLHSSAIKEVLGYKDFDEVIHRDNMVVL